MDLAVKAIELALNDAALSPEDIDLWMVSTASPHEQAPGLAATVKACFTSIENQTPTQSLTSGCSGFNLNLERAVEFLKCNSKAKHVVIAHTETMSSFLTEKNHFVPFVTFGDGAGAVILSKTETHKKEGLIVNENFQDLKMIDFVGVDAGNNLYMNDKKIKDRAVENIINTCKNILHKSKWNLNDVDIVIPHQTGNAILYPVAEELKIPKEKFHLEAQHKYGNVSGSTVLFGLSLLNNAGKLKENMKILSATAGVGGKYGGFSYIVPKRSKKEKTFKPLNNKKV